MIFKCKISEAHFYPKRICYLLKNKNKRGNSIPENNNNINNNNNNNNTDNNKFFV